MIKLFTNLQPAEEILTMVPQLVIKEELQKILEKADQAREEAVEVIADEYQRKLVMLQDRCEKEMGDPALADARLWEVLDEF